MSDNVHSAERAQKNIKLLVVDDQPMNLQVMNAILSPEYEVLAVTSGDKAIELCKKTLPDLILMDVIMPQKNGWEVCKELKADPELAGIPVIFVTGLETEKEEDSCWLAGGVDFIQKPVNPTTLKHRVRAHLTLKFQSDLLRNMAYVDGLTGVYNRRYFNEAYDRELRQVSRSRRELAVALIDIDYFKKFNDAYGHLEGDDCLRCVAESLRSVMRRPNDIFARYGGEEFACILPETSSAGAQNLINKMLLAVQQLQIEHKESPHGIVTVSIGVACVDAQKVREIPKLLAIADERLYAAKQEGRNRIAIG